MSRLALLLLAVAAAAGCGNQALRTINFQPAAQVNGGRPFYLLVRVASEKEFFGDSYKKIVGMVYPPSEDPSVLAARLIWPGRAERVQVTVADKKSFAVYVLYTSPGEPWKVLVSPPLRSQYDFVLEGGRIAPRPVAKP